MTDIADAGDSGHTRDARAAISAAVRHEHDFGGWLAAVLASVAADLGSTDALIASRAGSWEAAHVRALVNGTVGWDEEYLAKYKEPLP
ncbi:MAG: hypothetical protein ACXVHB_06825 [Solirubrobacteraceae bacterium]